MDEELPYHLRKIVIPQARDGKAVLRDAFMSLDRWDIPPDAYDYRDRPCDCGWCREKSRTPI